MWEIFLFIELTLSISRRRHGCPESNTSDKEISRCPEYRYATELKAEYNNWEVQAHAERLVK